MIENERKLLAENKEMKGHLRKMGLGNAVDNNSISRNRSFAMVGLALVFLLMLQLSIAKPMVHLDTWLRSPRHTVIMFSLNLSVMFAWVVIVRCLCGRFWLSAFVALLPVVLLSLGNVLKMTTLGQPVNLCSDLGLIGEVLPMLGGLLRPWHVIFLLAFLGLPPLALWLDKAHPVQSWPRQRRVSGSICAVAFLVLPTFTRPLLAQLNLLVGFTTDLSVCCVLNGFPLITLASLRDLGHRQQVIPPPNYSETRVREICQRILDRYRPGPAPTSMPDIVLVEVEAMADFTQAKGLSHPIDWLSHIHALQGSDGKIKFVSPAFGGRSINADFEACTGFSTRFFAPGTDFVVDALGDRGIPSLARVLEARGYETIALIPTSPTLFRHSWFFPKGMGFQETLFQEQLGGHVMGDIPDRAMTNRILKELAKPQARPRFLYVQMERNHLPWTAAKGFHHPEAVPQHPMKGEAGKALEVYLQGVYESDSAIGFLAEGLKAAKKPAVLGAFGDHLPALGGDVLAQLQVSEGTVATLPRNALKLHSTPGVIWTTNPKGRRVCGLVGMNYIPGLLLQAAGMSHPFYTAFLSVLRDKVPALNPAVACAANGEPETAIPASAEKEVEEYRLIQYDMLFGKEYAKPLLFTEVIPATH